MAETRLKRGKFYLKTKTENGETYCVCPFPNCKHVWKPRVKVSPANKDGLPKECPRCKQYFDIPASRSNRQESHDFSRGRNAVLHNLYSG